jgi:hypothetical protein
MKPFAPDPFNNGGGMEYSFTFHIVYFFDIQQQQGMR